MCRGSDGLFFDAMCNQTDISTNKNKFYVCQLVTKGNDNFVFTRWGRVGESGAVQVCVCVCVYSFSCVFTRL